MIEPAIHTCYTLKMSRFISCLLGQDTIPNWEDIYSEYIGLKENKGVDFILSMLKDIAYLQTRQYIIFKCVEVLSNVYNAELVSELRSAGCKGAFNWDDAAQYINDLKAAQSYAKRFTSQIKKKEKEIDEYNKRYDGQSAQRKDFDIQAVTLGKYLGYRVSLDETTVAEWCAIINEYERYCEVVHAQQNNTLNNGRR